MQISGPRSVASGRETASEVAGNLLPFFLVNSILFLLTQTVSSISGWLMFLDKLDLLFLKCEEEEQTHERDFYFAERGFTSLTCRNETERACICFCKEASRV